MTAALLGFTSQGRGRFAFMAKKAPNSAASPDTWWQSESDHSTLSRADEIRKDTGRMAGVRKYHKKATRDLMKAGRSIGVGGKR